MKEETKRERRNDGTTERRNDGMTERRNGGDFKTRKIVRASSPIVQKLFNNFKRKEKKERKIEYGKEEKGAGNSKD